MIKIMIKKPKSVKCAAGSGPVFFDCIGLASFCIVRSVPNESGFRIFKPNYRKEVYAP
jgi:hypothetical protein